jgi:two-component system sensor histidine kinase/response regulator
MDHKHTILCVDDEPHNLDALRRTLRKEYNVLTALNGVEGLELLEQHPVSLIISDQRMPQMTGVEFLEKSVDRHPEVIRIILTGFTDIEDLIGAINTGRVYRYITKPWEPNDLRVTIRRALESLELNQENRRLFDDVIRLEKLATVGQVASGIAHEVRNQLSVIMGVQILREKFPDDDTISRVTDRVTRAKDRIVNLLDEIKSYGKQKDELLHQTQVSVEDLFENTKWIVSLDPDVKSMELQFCSANGLQLNCDKNKITQVLINLIRNAAHAMGSEGRILIKAQSSGNKIRIDVIDQGSGIEEENLEKIWQPFFSTRGDKGTGLGLAICKRIVEAHDGIISCESTIGKGTTFSLILS